MDKLKIISYNSTGFNFQRVGFIQTLLNNLDIDIFLGQEHFILSENSQLISNEFLSFNMNFTPATKNDNTISKGRPSGGLVTLWKKTLNKRISVVKISDSSRVQAIDIDNRILLFNCYFPYDTQDANFNDWDLQKCINVINEVALLYPNHSVIVGGDINTHFDRNTPFVNMVRDWVIESNWNSVWWDNPIDFTYANFSNNRVSYSTIDHFLLNEIASTIVQESGVLHLGENLSNHAPIYLTIETPEIICENSDTNSKESTQFIPSWSKASENQLTDFKNDLNENLSNIKIGNGLLCKDVHCLSSQHRTQIDKFTFDILNCLEQATTANIPPVNVPHQKNIPGWKDLIQPYKDDANFWYAIWLSCGKPLNCQVHYVMKHTRNQYHYAIRRVKRNIEFVRNEKFLEHCKNKNPENLLRDFKKIKNAKKMNVNSMDGFHNDKDISQHFANVYKDLYNRTDTTNLLQEEYSLLSAKIEHDDYNLVDLISPSKISLLISKLDRHRNDSLYKFKSDAFVYGKNIISEYLCLLFQNCLIHGYLPKNILLAKLQPIIKDKLGNKCSSSNYRAIGISSLILKLFDLVFLDIFEESLSVSEQQYGFQKKCSTGFCTFTVKETVNYFVNRNTPVFACFLDMTKAFDLINYHKLFVKLRSRIHPLFLRLLCFIYLNQSACVVWGNAISEEFSVKNGVKQGAILSPTLFSVYIDDIFEILSRSGYGCTINNNYYGAIAYADDMVLLCPNKDGLQKMFNIVKKIFDEIDLIISFDHINPEKSKTKCLAFGVKNDPPPLFLNGSPIPWVSKFKHLGHYLYKDGSSTHDTVYKKNVFIGKFHSLCQLLKNHDPLIYVRLIKIYMIDFYGSNLWNLYDKFTQKFFTSWNRMIRNVFKLPYNSHRYLIEPISGITHLKTMLSDRFLKFYDSVMNCNKKLTRELAHIQSRDCRSDFGRNISNMCREMGTLSFLNIKKGDIKYFPIKEDDKWRVPRLRELLQQNIYNINPDLIQIENLINYISTS